MFRTDHQRFSLGVQRGEGAGPFVQSDVDRLQQLMPHLQRLLMVRERLTRAEAETRLAGAFQTASLRTAPHGGALMVPRRSSGLPYRLMLTPVGDKGDGAVLVLIDDGEAAATGLAETFRTMFGLTAAETDLALGLSQGQTPEEIAQARDVRLTTVRTQVRSMLSKLERRRLTEAVIDLTRVAALQAPER